MAVVLIAVVPLTDKFLVVPVRFTMPPNTALPVMVSVCAPVTPAKVTVVQVRLASAPNVTAPP